MPNYSTAGVDLTVLIADLQRLKVMRRIENGPPCPQTIALARSIADKTPSEIPTDNSPEGIVPGHALYCVHWCCYQIADHQSERQQRLLYGEYTPAPSAEEIEKLINELQSAVPPIDTTESIRVVTVQNEDEIPAEYRLRGSATGEPLTVKVVADPVFYGINGPYLSNHYRGPRLKLGRAYIYKHSYVAALADSKRRPNDE